MEVTKDLVKHISEKLQKMPQANNALIPKVVPTQLSLRYGLIVVRLLKAPEQTTTSHEGQDELLGVENGAVNSRQIKIG